MPIISVYGDPVDIDEATTAADLKHRLNIPDDTTVIGRNTLVADTGTPIPDADRLLDHVDPGARLSFQPRRQVDPSLP